jgi:hypothetical protein
MNIEAIEQEDGSLQVMLDGKALTRPMEIK